MNRNFLHIRNKRWEYVKFWVPYLSKRSCTFQLQLHTYDTRTETERERGSLLWENNNAKELLWRIDELRYNIHWRLQLWPSIAKVQKWIDTKFFICRLKANRAICNLLSVLEVSLMSTWNGRGYQSRRSILPLNH